MNNDLKILTIKNIMSLSDVSEASAKRIKKNIIKDLDLKGNTVLLAHYKVYFCVGYPEVSK